MTSPRKGPYAGPHHSFPIGNKVHARLAIPMAKRSERKGNITRAQERKIISRARAKLRGGKRKGR